MTKFTMNGGTIGNNVASANGGGIYVYQSGAASLKGSASVSGNSGLRGGGVYVHRGQLTLLSMHDSASITNNQATDAGDGVYLEGVLGMSGGMISSGGSSGGSGIGVYVSSDAYKFEMGGTAVVDASNAVHLSDGKSITILSSLTGTTPVATISPAKYADGVEVLSAAVVATPAINMASEVTKFAVASNPSSGGTNYSIIASGGTGVLGHYGESSLASLLAAAKSGDILDVRLTQGFNLNSPIEVAAGVTLNLSSESPVAITLNPGAAGIDSVLKCIGGSLTIGGNVTLDGNQQPTDNGVVYVDQGGTFTLRGKIISGWGTNAGGVSINGGSTFHMYDGAEIRDCTATGTNARQGGVRLSASTFYMYGGTIKDNSATYDAGVRVIDMNGAPSRFYMYGGEITGNSALQTGGGVTVDKNCIFEMTGGSITGNNAPTGPDVYSYPSFTGTISVPPGENYVKG